MKLIIDIPEEYKEQFIKNKCDDLFNSLATNEFGYVLRKSFETATLETQPCEDCISRQEAISAIQDEYYADAVGIDIVDIIAHLPSVTPTRPTGRWIPCTERLPEDYEDVLVCDRVDMFVGWCEFDGLSKKWHSLDDNYDYDTPIIAWMPLPQPYKAESEDKEWN